MRRVWFAVVRRTVVLGEWLDAPLDADLAVAVEADRLGYEQVWIGEAAKLDAPAMASTIVARTSHIEPVLGPLAVTVRSPVQIALAAATVAGAGRRTHIALGTSSDVVARWHGRDRKGAATLLEQTTRDVRSLIDGGRVNGFRLREPLPETTLTVAAFGPRAVAAAAGADRMVLNMVTAQTAGRLAARHPNTAVWLAAAIDPTDRERRWLSRGYVGYLPAPGYGEMFAEAGFGDLVEFARSRPHPKELAARIPDDLVDAVALIGAETTVLRRIDEYARAGITEIGVVVPSLDQPSGRRTLEALAPFDRRRETAP